MLPKICSIPECEKPLKARGWCEMHYCRWKKYGDPMTCLVMQSATPENRFWAKVTKDGATPAHNPSLGPCWEWAGKKTDKGYGVFRLDGRTLKSHRASYSFAHGEIPEGLEIDHRCHNRACVNPGHLRPATAKQNAENHSGLNRNNKSGVRGVSWDKQSRKWRADVGHCGKAVHVGSFLDLNEAADAVLAKRIELHTRNDLDRIPA